MSIRKLFYALPPSARYISRRLFYLPLDLIQKRYADNGIPLPPKGMIYTGGGSFLETGKKFSNYFQTYTDLKADSYVLDIGSGIGRMAIPLTNVLSKEGSYEGFDAIELGVNWCLENISSKFSNFKFRYIPLLNDLYRNEGIEASKFNFPYASNNFDLSILISVFTHMLPSETAQYLNEISRVLKPDAYCFATFFVIDSEAETAMQSSSFKFIHKYKAHYLFSEKVKGANVAYNRTHLEASFKDAELEIKHFFRGNWSGLKEGKLGEFQDIYILRKK